MAVGVLFVLLASSLFLKGLIPSMAEFKIPENILNSAHYYDAIFWVYVHMMVIGVLFILIGISVKELQHQQLISILLLLITAFYTYLDFRTSDSMFGNALYKGEASVIPAYISLIVNLVFLQLSIRLFLKRNI